MKLPFEMNRKNYALTYFVGVPAILFITWPFTLILDSDQLTYALLGLGGVYLLVSIWLLLLRLENIGKSKWWALGFLVPILNLYVVPMVWSYPPNIKEQKMDKKGYAIFAVVFMLVIISTTIKILIPE